MVPRAEPIHFGTQRSGLATDEVIFPEDEIGLT
jgi:hypothetical protein